MLRRTMCAIELCEAGKLTAIVLSRLYPHKFGWIATYGLLDFIPLPFESSGHALSYHNKRSLSPVFVFLLDHEEISQ